MCLSRRPSIFLAHQKRDQVDELLLREALLQPLRHGAQGGRPMLLDVGLRQQVLLALAIGQRQRRLGFGDFDAPSVLDRS